MWKGLGGHRCSSPNHKWGCSDAVREGLAIFWECPRCKRHFCTTCEGGTDWEVCDECFVWIMSRRHIKKLFLKLISRWAWHGQKKALRDEFFHDIKSGMEIQ